MGKVHLRLDGSWAVCRAEQRACPRGVHLADTTLAQARLIPVEYLAALVAAVTPQQVVEIPMSAGRNVRIWLDAEGSAHRDYDLPSMETDDGFRAWTRHGQLHRVGAPAIVNPTRKRSWVLNLDAETGLRETVYTEDSEQHWVNGVQR